MGVIIHIHRVLIDRAPHKGPRNVVIEDEVVVADEVERRWAIAGNPDRTKQVPENDEVAPDSYKLFFNSPFGFNPFVL